MNKKILGAAVTVVFCICLIAMSDIPESDVKEPARLNRIYAEETDAAEENDMVTAGVSLVLSEYSFTTESDEKTNIKKNEAVRVAAPEAVEEVLSEETVQEEAEVETEINRNRWGITLTEEEIELLARIVWLEANGEPEVGQQAVVEVVFNRMASDKFPNTLYDVLSQKNPVQFCSWKNRSIAKPTEKEYQSIEQVLNGNTNILRNDTLYFSREALTPNLDVKIGGHSFCY